MDSPINHAGRMPFFDEGYDGFPNFIPHGASRAINHFRSKQWINFHCFNNGGCDHLYPDGVSTGGPLARKENSLFPCRHVQNVLSKAPTGVRIASEGGPHESLRLERCVPLLELL